MSSYFEGWIAQLGNKFSVIFSILAVMGFQPSVYIYDQRIESLKKIL